MNRIATSWLVAFALFAVATSALAAVPSPANSTLPPCMALCPMGDMPFTVTIRDFANNPIAGSSVTLSFGGCPASAFICDPLPSDPYTTDLTLRTLRMFTDAAGKATFPARVGGTGAAGCAAVFADGVPMRNYALASPDQNGNGMCVSLIDTDDAIFALKLGLADPTADFDCSGGPVDAADETIFFSHHSHACLGFVDPVQRNTWGSLKLHYR